MYIIKNVEEYISRTKERIENAISQNNYKHAFIIFVSSIVHLKDPELSDFIHYYEEMASRNFVAVSI